jgi:hypothetical protein
MQGPGTTPDVLRLAPLAGVAAVALQLVAFPMLGTFAYRPSGAEALVMMGADPGRVDLGVLLGGFYSVACLVVFGGAVAGSLRAAGADVRLAAIALGGGIVTALAIAFGYAYIGAGASQVADPGGLDASTAGVLYRLFRSMFAGLLSMGLAALIGATGLGALGTGLLPRWLSSASLVAAIGLLTPLHWLFEGLALGWIVIVGVLLARAPAPRSVASRATGLTGPAA